MSGIEIDVGTWKTEGLEEKGRSVRYMDWNERYGDVRK